MNPFDLDRQSMPEWYSLSYDGFLHINVPAKYGRIIEEIQSTNSMIDFLRQNLGLGRFYCQNQGEILIPIFDAISTRGWGFNDSLCLGKKENGDFEWVVHFANCENNETVNYQRMYEISASLSILFQGLNFLEIEEDDSCQRQLLNIDCLYITRSIAGASFSAVISEALCRWLGKQPHESYHPEITLAMQNAHARMFGNNEHLNCFTNALMRQPQWINLNCPGNACGLDPESYYVHEDEGYKLLPHNVDTPVQQITFLADLAKLYELAQSEILSAG